MERSAARVEGLPACPPACLAAPVLRELRGDRQVDERPAVGCRWCTLRPGGGGRWGWRWTRSQRLHPPHPSPSSISLSTHMIPVLEKNPPAVGGREGGTAGLQHQGLSLRERQNLLFNGKRQHPATSALVRPHVVIYVSLNLPAPFPFVLLTVSWCCFSLLLTGCCQSPAPGPAPCYSFKEVCHK